MPARIAALPTHRGCILLAAAVILTNTGIALADDPGGEVVRIDQEDAETSEKRGWHHTPLQISLFSGAQIFPRDWTVVGISFNVIHGEQSTVYGLDLGIFNTVTNRLSGFQTGMVNITEGDVHGIQAGGLNRVGRHLRGAQIGIANRVLETAYGAQFGVYNDTGPIHGVQVGVVNFAESLRGVQIGVSNFNRPGNPLTFLPLVNVGW